MRILHVLDHSIPLQSGYTFRTLSLLTECLAPKFCAIPD
jgi:phosphatidyl-myo-inositol dimannoside synthase